MRWYLRFSLSYRDLEELLNERGVTVDHTTVWHWVQRYGPELERRVRHRCAPQDDAGTLMKRISELLVNGFTCIERLMKRALPLTSSYPVSEALVRPSIFSSMLWKDHSDQCLAR